MEHTIIPPDTMKQMVIEVLETFSDSENAFTKGYISSFKLPKKYKTEEEFLFAFCEAVGIAMNILVNEMEEESEEDASEEDASEEDASRTL